MAVGTHVEILFAGPGEMREKCREFDWASSPLGPVDAWSRSLRTIVFTLLGSRQPMFLFWGPEQVQIYNDAYRPSLGQGGRQSRALGMRGRDFWTDVWETIGPQIEQVMAGGPATWFEDQYLPIERNGRLEEVYWTYSYSPVRDDDDSVGGTLVVCQETTNRVMAERELRRNAAELQAANADLKASEERFRTVQEASPDVSLLMRAIRDDFGRISDFEFTFANPAVEPILLGGAEQVVGRTFREVFPESVAAGRLEKYVHIVETGEPLLEDVQYTRGPIAHGLRLSVVKVGDGVHLAAADLSERFHAAAERERLLKEAHREREAAEAARRDAEAANRAKSEFLAIMSHELRTPLNAIGGYAELVELGIYGPLTDEQRNALSRIQASQRHLLGLITSVLNYARVEGGYLTYTVEAVPLKETLATCEALTAPQMRAKRISYTFAADEPDLTVCADREKLQQIVLNLLSNAVKFTPAEGRIDVRCTATGDVVLVHVKDTGVGISAEQLTRVFEPFVQVDTKFTRPHEGVGLGLAISRDLARGMGGDLSAESVVGSGSVFTLTLPRA